MREFPQRVWFSDITDGKIVRGNSERYCFGLLRVTVTYYLTTECLLIRGPAELTRRFSPTIEQIIGRGAANSQIDPYQPSPKKNSPSESTPRIPPNLKEHAYKSLIDARDCIAIQSRYSNECISLFELTSHITCDKSTETDNPVEFANTNID